MFVKILVYAGFVPIKGVAQKLVEELRSQGIEGLRFAGNGDDTQALVYGCRF